MINYNIKEVAQRLKGLRIALDMTEEDLCRATGISVD